jgi:hypothetical protein
MALYTGKDADPLFTGRNLQSLRSYKIEWPAILRAVPDRIGDTAPRNGSMSDSNDLVMSGDGLAIGREN